MPVDYERRQYLSVGEFSAFTGLPVPHIHRLVKRRSPPAERSAGRRYRFDLRDIRPLRKRGPSRARVGPVRVEANGTVQRVVREDARAMTDIPDRTVHLAITSPPYFNAKMYSEAAPGDLGNIHDLETWLKEIGDVWKEVFRVLQPGRKFFLNIMNLPVREAKSFRCLNLTGKTIDLCESLGFVFKRDIVWHKTNGARAHFGTYPFPGGILINNMHEFLLEFEKRAKPGTRKYGHVTREQRENSRLDREFWLSIKNSDVWLMKPEKSGANRSHVAPFPLDLPSRLIRAFSFEGELVLDPFVGSGTTLAAAALLGRNGVGYDIHSGSCRMTEDRLRGIELRRRPRLPLA